MFIFSLLDCCALIFLSVYFVSLPETGGGRPGALRPRDRAGAGPVWGPGQGRGNEEGGRRRARVPWVLARLEASPGWRRAPVAQLRPSPGGPSQPYSRSARARPAHCFCLPRRPDPLCHAPALALGFSLWPSGERVEVYFFLAPEREGSRFVLQLPWARAFRLMLGVRRARAHVPGAVSRGRFRAEPGGDDLAPLVILWATPPLPAPLFSRVLELVGNLSHPQVDSFQKRVKCFLSRCAFVGSAGNGLF